MRQNKAIKPSNFTGSYTPTKRVHLSTKIAVNHIKYEWKPRLNKPTMRVIYYLYEQTTKKHLHWAELTYEQIASGMAFSRRHAIRVVKRLFDYGVVSIEPGRNQVNKIGLNYGLTGSQLDKVMGIADDCKRGDIFDARGDIFPPHTPYIDFSSSFHSEEKEIIQPQNFAKAGENNSGKENMVDLSKLKSVSEATRQKTKSARTKKIAKGNSISYWTLWAEQCRESFPDVPVTMWPAYQAKHVKVALSSAIQIEQAREFFEIVISNWQDIVKRNFSYMTDKPAPQCPKISFLLRFLDTFVEEYVLMRNGSVDSTPIHQKTVINRKQVKHLEEDSVAIREQNKLLRAELKTLQMRFRDLKNSRTTSPAAEIQNKPPTDDELARYMKMPLGSVPGHHRKYVLREVQRLSITKTYYNSKGKPFKNPMDL